MQQSCANCRFCIGQSCRRHAPTGLNPSYASPQWPVILEPSAYWCGDHEPKRGSPDIGLDSLGRAIDAQGAR